MKKGFTLVELLIVIGILAVLSTATVLILNPAQILQESRDTQRLNDLNTLSSAISLMQATAMTPDLDGGAFVCGTNFGSTIAGATSSFGGSLTLAQAGARGVDGTGWMAANLTLIPGGSPLAVLPLDPTNTIGTAGFNYQYACNSAGKYELDANMESTKYQAYEGADGGSNANIYEIGSVVSL